MGKKKKYYCDFCNRHFNDDKNTRTKHLNSVGHVNAKREHYNLFRDLETILQEESVKKPCRKFHSEGFCSFGGSCTYCHYTRDELEGIRMEVAWRKQQEADKPTLRAWLFKFNQKEDVKRQESQKLMWSTQLPPELMMNMAVLPPSMLPYSIQECIDADTQSWG